MAEKGTPHGLTTANAATSLITSGAIFCGGWITEIIDCVTTGTYDLVPPSGYRFDRLTTAWEIKTTGGTISTSPTFSVGSNSPDYDDYMPAQTAAGFTTQAAETSISPGTFVTPGVYKDITTNGVKVKISIAATGVNPVLTARFRVQGLLVPI